MRKYLDLVLICLSLMSECVPTLMNFDNGMSNETSSYLQCCCLYKDGGKTFIFTSDEVLKLIFCPSEPPSSCSTDLFTYYNCSDVLTKCPSAKSGYYNIGQTNGSTVSIYCDMEGVNCDGKGGWMRVAYLNMSDPAGKCPPGFRKNEASCKGCARNQSGPGCLPVTFSSYNINYTQVCGRVAVYQQGSPDAWCTCYTIVDINGECVNLTRDNPKQHVWICLQNDTNDVREECPCFGTNNLNGSFVGNDSICDSGKSTEAYTLLDGKQYGLVEEGFCNVTFIP